MNIDMLVAAAKKIDELAGKQEARTKAWQKLAKDVRDGLDPKEIALRKKKLDEVVIIDFGTAIDELRLALHAPGAKEDQI